ncbi:transcription antitermination factor NusB [Oceanobacillus alkalisoli]|uniref:transcription antitermination factor NusB n=1 Tax=Oceanobacillus alkalisoli TaxID=2925113 RepID=UPI001EEFE8A5|nr:transcription antitermination factor NusB [Oceanobacillus alkalisoli]MCF3941730.1 transcription antitermination factor NusB [Oceanobacillus alkalisoli]MCG5103011.1 transcription antitermination factor NusB [Oceanobacillus alkalisoli]
MKRSEAREKAFQFLFQIDINLDVPKENIQEYVEEQGNDPFLNRLIQGVLEQKSSLDEIIASHLENWSLDRLAAVERTILRLSTFEIKYLEDIPLNVSINEAVELGNRFGDEKSGKFVNGVLSKIVEEKGNEL